MSVYDILNKMDAFVESDAYKTWVAAFYASIFIISVTVGMAQLMCYFMKKLKMNKWYRWLMIAYHRLFRPDPHRCGCRWCYLWRISHHIAKIGD